MKWNVLLELELKCSLLLMVAFLVILLMRRFSSAQRYFVLMLAVSGGLLIPAAHFVLPHWETKILPSTPMETKPAPQQASEPAAVVAFSEPTETVPALTVTPTITSVEHVETIFPTVEPELSTPAKEVASEEGRSFSWLQISLFVWLGGAVIMLLSLVVGWLSVWRIVRRASEVQGVWSETRERVRGRLAISRKVSLLECSSRWAPMAFGLFRPTIVLPVDGRAWPEQKRSAVLVHELAHVKRNDCLLHSICTIALALHWFNPLFWIAARRLRLEREHACDDYVLTNGAPAADYADQLLEVARMQSGRVPLLSAAITMARKNALEGRLLAILDGGRRRGAFGLGAVCLALLLTVGIALPLASATGAKAKMMKDDVAVVVEDEVSENANVPPSNLVEAVEPSEEAVGAWVEFKELPPDSRTEMSSEESAVSVPESSSSDALPDTEFVSESPNFSLTNSPPSLFVEHASVPIIDSGESGVAEVSEMTAAPFMGEWVELTDDASTALHFLVEQNGQALLEGGDVRTRMQWKQNYDELLLTTSEGVRTADISPEGLLIYRKGGRAMMTFRRPGSTVELPVKETASVKPLVPTPSVKEQLESRFTAAEKISNTASRDSAFSGIALDAAKRGYLDQMWLAVKGIRNSDSRNNTANTCVNLLLELGLVKEATELAESISNTLTRDHALGRIAQQQTVVREDNVQESRAISTPPSEMMKALEARLTIAEQITLPSERDEVFAGIALDAARLGVVEPALKALDKMVFVSDRDDAAVRCADQFILLDLSEYAGQVAEKITFYSTKKEVIDKIARGSSPLTGGPLRATPRSTSDNGWTIHYSSEDAPSPEQAAAMQKQMDEMQKQMETMMESGVMQDQMGAMEKQMESMSKQMESMMNSMGTP